MTDGVLIDTIQEIMGVVPGDDRERPLDYSGVGKRAAMLIFLAAPEARFDVLRDIVEAAKDALFGTRYEQIASLKGSPLAVYKESLGKVFACLQMVRDATPDDIAAGMWDESSEACTTEFEFRQGWVDKCVIGDGPSKDQVEAMVKSPAMMHYFLGESLVKAGLDSSDKLDRALVDTIRSHLEFVFLFSWCASLLKHVGEAGGIPMDQEDEEQEARLQELSAASAAVVKYVAKGLEHLFKDGGDEEKDMAKALELMDAVPSHVPTVADGGYEQIVGYVAPLGVMKGRRDASCPSKK